MKNNYFKLFFIAVSMLLSSAVAAQFTGGGGSGSETNPYLIEDIDHWIELSDYVLSGETCESIYFQMQNDVDFNNFFSFVPVGDDTNSFAGYFDGGGYSILNLEPSSISGNYLGLFGKTTGGYIKNLTIQGGSFMGDTYVGALIGYNAGAEIENCNSDATVVIFGTSYIGGLIGYNGESSTVSGCESGATVSGLTYIGGLIGYSTGENVTDCISEAVVIGAGNYIGGLAGYNTAEIIDCFSEATVTTNSSTAEIGGLIGYNEGAVSGSGSRANVGNTSTVAENAKIGGLIGHNNQGAITNCFSEATVSSRASGNYTGGLIGQNNSAPVSSSYSNATVNVTVTTLGNFHVGGFIAESSGVISDCYSSADVTTSGQTPFAAGFIAHNNGTISNCYVSRNAELTANQTTQGKFGGLVTDNLGLIENCYSEADITVRGASSSLTAGGLVSNNWNVIENSYVPATVVISSEGNATTLGGLVGYTSSSSLIQDCYSEATVRATNAGTGNLGGLIGTHAGEVKSSYATGTLEAIGTSSFTMGGLIANDYGGTTNNCYSTAILIGSSDHMRMGGLVGVVAGSTKISNSYAVPDLQAGSSTSRFIGAFSGMNAPAAPLGFLSNNYHLIISGRAAQGGTIPTPSPEITGKSSDDLKLSAMIDSPGSSKNSLKFGQSLNPLPWKVDFTPNTNNGYPILAWQTQPFSISGTVFPFVFTEDETFNSLFPFTASLYELPPAGLDDPIEYLLNSTPAHTTKAVYYDSSMYVPGTPKYPGILGRLNQPGIPINWARISKTQDPATDYTPVSGIGDVPLGNPVGVFTFENVTIGKEYILYLHRPGLLARYAKVTIEQDSTLNHRFLIPGDVNGDSRINAQDVSLLNGKFSAYGRPGYDPYFDLDGNAEVDGHDNSLLNYYLNCTLNMYSDTYNWVIEYYSQ